MPLANKRIIILKSYNVIPLFISPCQNNLRSPIKIEHKMYIFENNTDSIGLVQNCQTYINVDLTADELNNV